MQNPRRPPADRTRAPGARERPISWTRRLEQAREARAKVLAAREAKEGDAPTAREPAAAEPATPGPQSPGEVPAPSPEHESWGTPSDARRATMMWRIAGGVAVGAAVGAVLIWVLLAGGQKTPLGVQTGGTTAPSVASAPPEVAPERPAQDPAAEAPPAVEEAAADEEADAAAMDVAALPEVTAADRARGAARQTVAAVEKAVGPDSDDPAEASRPEDAAGTVSVTEVAALADAEPASLPSGVPDPEGPEASGDEPPVSMPVSAEAGAGRDAVSDAAQRGSTQAGAARDGLTEIAQSSGTPDAADADGAAADTREESVATGAERTAEVAAPVLAPTSDPPRPPEVRQTAIADARGAAVAETTAIGAPDAEDNVAQQETAVAGDGLLYVHAAPGVTSEELAAVAARLTAAGYAVEETRRVDFRISQTNVRYFHEEDADVSSGVAETLSATSRDFTDYEPSPDPGTIEVWLEG